MLMVGVAIIMQTTPTVLFAAFDRVHARDVVVPTQAYCMSITMTTVLQ